jgi:hypothetical protein
MTPASLEKIPKELTDFLGAQIASQALKLSMAHPLVPPHPASGTGREFCFLAMAVLYRSERKRVGQTLAAQWAKELLNSVWNEAHPMITGWDWELFAEDFQKRLEVYWELPSEESSSYELPHLVVGSCMGFFIWKAHEACKGSAYPMRLKVLTGDQTMSFAESRNLPDKSFAIRTYNDALPPIKNVRHELAIHFILPKFKPAIQALPPSAPPEPPA